MKALLTVLLFYSVLNPFAQTKTVAIDVAVLGAKHQTVRYYHPINGNYNITPKTVSFKKSVIEKLKHFVLIQPALNLHDSINIIQANSLRHYVDPSELIYVDWKMGRDATNYLRLDTFATKSKSIRNEKYQSTVQDYFNPFFISKYEVTNQEYREFTEWVLDSIFREAIYASETLSDEQAYQMLNIPNGPVYSEQKMKWEEVSNADRLLNRELFSFNTNFNYRKEFRDDLIIPIISQFYRRPNERYYKRRSIDTKKLNYRYYSIDTKGIANRKKKEPVPQRQNGQIRHHEDLSRFIVDHNLNIHPDTTCWQKFDHALFSQVTGNMYFWHPAFDNMPVVGVSHDQAKAYCDWKQRQLQKTHPEISKDFTIELPNLMEYEWAITSGYGLNVASQIQDNNLTTDLYFGTKNERPDNFIYERSLLQKVHLPYDIQNLKAHKHFLKTEKKHAHDKFSHFSTQHEYRTRAQQNYLASGVEFLSNNASEWMSEDYETHYKALFEAYINYKCFSDLEYCEFKRNIDQNFDRQNDKDGHLIMGSNWYDERYGSLYGVNVKGLYAKRFKSKESTAATVGFRLVLRMN